MAAWRARVAAEDAKRPKAAERGYDPEWRALRAVVLAAEPDCRLCAQRGIARRAKVVDHIIPVRQRPDLRLDRANLQPLCFPCHNGKTNRLDGGFGRAPRSR